ncbi:uncharacterized protein GGS22DRAFT_147245 [Annulohypoxylon maeteangense]|uniref:uncharacterized protein n=1 Tax=Annulohypoxylon maeteangense TaxID=1927788 RepID=UPI002007C8F6|nr:uncharacterized protein GGS22DRAFT_147245 [Annulohypoxylon maeteangense]KAI0884824.1 hypothetical protein GGS22DRAFT_147245 [Annulohypoxylon maeteangense]
MLTFLSSRSFPEDFESWNQSCKTFEVYTGGGVLVIVWRTITSMLVSLTLGILLCFHQDSCRVFFAYFAFHSSVEIGVVIYEETIGLWEVFA